MTDPRNYKNDSSMLPSYGNKYNLTLALGHSILIILPSSILILVFPILLYHYTRKPAILDYGLRFYAKIITSLCLLYVEVSILALNTKHSHTTALAVIASSLCCVASLCAGIILGIQHRHSPHPSSVLNLYLALTIPMHTTMAGLCIQGNDLDLFTQAVLLAIAAVLRAIILLLQKRSRRRASDPESLNFIRLLLSRLRKTLFFGFYNVLESNNLDELEPNLLTTHLNDNFLIVWAQTPKNTTHCLLKACAISLAWPVFKVIISRLFFTLFNFSQPLLLQWAIYFINNMEDGFSLSYAIGVIGSTLIVYLGIAVSRALYTQRVLYLATSIRGILISQIITKSLTLEHSKAGQSTAMTFVRVEIESLITSLNDCFEFAISFIDITIGTYLLSMVIGNAAFLNFVPLLVSAVAAQYLGSRIGLATSIWDENTQHRISQTIKVLKNITGIKILGLDLAIMKYLQDLRIKETKTSQKARKLSVITVTTRNFAYAMTPVIVLAGTIFWIGPERFSAREVFATMSIILIISEPLMSIISGYQALRMNLERMQRIQAFLTQDEKTDGRTIIRRHSSLDGHSQNEPGRAISFDLNTASADVIDVIIQAQQLSIKDQSANRFLLRDASFAIQRSTLVLVTGATGSGKSLLLRTLLGEVKFDGSLCFAFTGNIGYCDQTPWIRNTSIRKNIIGEAASFDASWYETVIEACYLAEDFTQLPEGDETCAGSEGACLSGGQRQRIALARAVYSRAAILILDDPLSGLDQHTLRGIVNNLFGPNGILKELRTTVIMATHSAYYAQFAQTMISLDSGANLTATEIIRRPRQREHSFTPFSDTATESTSSYDDSLQSDDTNADDSDTSAEDNAERLRLIEAQENTLRRKGNLALCLFYISSTKAWMVVLWFAAVFATCVSEVMPLVYIRIWLDANERNNLYFVACTVSGLFCCCITAVMMWFWYNHVVKTSSNSLHRMLLDTISRATLSYLTGTNSSLIINRFTQDISLVSKDLPQSVLLSIYVFCNVVLMGIIIFSGARFAITLLPLIILLFYVLQHFYLRTSQQIRYLDLEAKTPLCTELSETISGIYHIRSYGIVAEVLDRGLMFLDISQKPFYYMLRIQQWLMLGMDITTLIIAITVMSFGILQRNTSQAAIGLSLVYLIPLGAELSFLTQTWAGLETALGALARIRNFERDTPIEQEIRQEAPQDWPTQGHIIISNMTASYSSMDVPYEVLRNISIEITPGQRIGIIGRTGSGKTSLLLSILNFLDYQGSIQVDGKTISATSQRVLRSQITIITQDPIELDASVRYNLLPFQLQRSDEKNRQYDAEVVQVLCRIRLWSYIASHGGLDSSLSSITFSRGQLQMLSIARAILHNHFTKSKVILIDECTSNIDLEMERYIQDVIYEAFLSCTVLMVTHRPETLRRSDIILEMSEGRVVQLSSALGPSSSINSPR